MVFVGRVVRERAVGGWVGPLGGWFSTWLVAGGGSAWSGLGTRAGHVGLYGIVDSVDCSRYVFPRLYATEERGRRKKRQRQATSKGDRRVGPGGFSEESTSGEAPRVSRTHHIARIPTSMLPMVALVGRPNVGKSALFNRLVKKRVSIVHNTPLGHVTRDYQEGRAMLGDVEFLAVDTSGLEPVMMGDARRSGVDGLQSSSEGAASENGQAGSSINMRATALTAGILRQSDVVLFLLDGKEGVTGVDMDLGRWFRKMSSGDSGGSLVSKIIPVVNKCEGRVLDRSNEVGRMGFHDGVYVGVSAETGEGMADLYRVLQERLDDILEERAASVSRLGDEVQVMTRVGKDGERSSGGGARNVGGKYPKVAIMGLTNVGKSTLLNRLVGHDRCITGPEPGLTRDAITVELKDEEGNAVMEVVDTAGWIRKTRLKAHDDSDGAVAEMTMREGKTVLRFVHVVFIIVDCARILAKLDDGSMAGRDSVLSHAEAALVADAVGQGRAVVVGLNKVDVCKSWTKNGASLSDTVQETRAVEAIRESLKHVTPELGETATVLPLSAIDGDGVDDIVPTIQNIYKTWNTRVPTAKLNAWLRELKVEKAHVGGGNSVSRIKYLSQVKSRPPTFVVFVSGKTKLGESVERFVANRLRDEFDLAGVPVRVIQRHTQQK